MVFYSSSSNDITPLDSSNTKEVLQSLYRAVPVPFTPGNGNLDATLFMKDPSLSSFDTGGTDIPTMTVTSTEDPNIYRSRSVQKSGKSVGVIDSSDGLGVAVSDPATFTSLAAGGALMND